MTDPSFALAQINRICADFAAALQHSELRIYAVIAVIAVLSALLFPRQDDPDQI